MASQFFVDVTRQVPSSSGVRVQRALATLAEQTEKMKAIKPSNLSNVRGVDVLSECRNYISQILRNAAPEIKNQQNVDESNPSVSNRSPG